MRKLVVSAAALVLTGAAVALSSQANAQRYDPGYAMGPGMMHGYGPGYYGMGPGMMHGSPSHRYYDYNRENRGRSDRSDEGYGYHGYGPDMMWQYQR